MKKLIILPLLTTFALADVTTVCTVETPNSTRDIKFIEKEGNVDMFSKGKSLALNRGVTIKRSSIEDGVRTYQSDKASANITIAIADSGKSVKYTFNGMSRFYENCKVLD
ncbi:hypothetical protein JHD49_03810 [Sulfurimonas sp. SAG-AH-194-C21]|nr:hypothetical protein [Sulfurimonas sp. SAG-AH-194-C21]MDF1883057.1 hypothetical protein [Sulfurimonas sp. SAG-AH-194-C21]